MVPSVHRACYINAAINTAIIITINAHGSAVCGAGHGVKLEQSLVASRLCVLLLKVPITIPHR